MICSARGCKATKVPPWLTLLTAIQMATYWHASSPAKRLHLAVAFCLLSSASEVNRAQHSWHTPVLRCSCSPSTRTTSADLRSSCVGSDMRGIVLHLQVLGWRNVGACAPCNSRTPQVAPASTATGPWLARAAEPHTTKTHTRGPQSHTQHGRRIKMTSTVFVLVLLLSFSDPGSCHA